MSLVLEIEHLLGVSFAARDQSSDVPDWPPQPDRVFSALVASWAARGERDEERHVLEWLEAQEEPRILASDAEPRTPHTVYVPPNDYGVPSSRLEAVRWYRDFLVRGVIPPEKGGHKKAWFDVWNVMPDQRKRAGLKGRNFPAARPHDPIVRLVWLGAMPDDATMSALNALAADTSYVGHSASLTRCRFRNDDLSPVATRAVRRRIYRGRLAELEHAFHAKPLRRPSPGAAVRATPDLVQKVISSVFSDDWLVLEHVDGAMPDIRAASLVAKELRNVLMSGYREIGLGEAIPAIISGHSANGRPASEPHLAIAPLAFVGARYASGVVFGFALIPPSGANLLDDSVFRRAFRRVTRASEGPDDETERRRQMVLDRLRLAFAAGSSSGRRSLDAGQYTHEARIWASCTPIVLDRHLKKATGNQARDEEIVGLIREACKNVCLPAPLRIVASKHSAIEGSPSAYPSGSAPRWTRWRLPESLASRQLIHAVMWLPRDLSGFCSA